ncbi:MAG: Tex-like N-terminal domain-containing protein, partial [Chloroflexota bacterium]
MPNRNYPNRIAQRLSLSPKQVASVLNLLDGGNTVPFIARYRKEMTGSLDELKLREVSTEYTRLQKVDDRRDTVRESIAEQGALTPELESAIEAADSVTELDDLYQPYKRKRRTRATVAQERGLTPLADLMQSQPTDRKSPDEHARLFLSDEVPTVEDALAGARDILAERMSDNPDIRRQVREKAMQFGSLVVSKVKNADDPKSVYASYYDYTNRVSRIRPHQTLAINRGESEKVLRVKLELEERDWLRPMQNAFRTDSRSPFRE